MLPKYRGAAPIQWAIINGDTSTGVSIQELSVGKFDRGRLLASQVVDIPPASTFHSLQPILATVGAELLVKTLTSFPEAQVSDSQ